MKRKRHKDRREVHKMRLKREEHITENWVEKQQS